MEEWSVCGRVVREERWRGVETVVGRGMGENISRSMLLQSLT